MTTFDSWEAVIRPPEDYLMHFRTKGSKNGVNRYQTESGKWTPLGLERRREREGFGEGRKARKEERKAEKEVRKAEKQVQKAERDKARAEKKEAQREAKEKAKADYLENMRKNSLSGMTDEELQAKINRIEMENKYKEMTKSPLLKMGEKIVANHIKKQQEAIEAEKTKKRQEREDKIREANQKFELAKLEQQTKQKELEANASAEKAKSEASVAQANANIERAKTDALDIQTGTRAKQIKLDSKKEKRAYKEFKANNTILGGFKKKANTILKGQGQAKVTELQGWAESQAAYQRGKTDARIVRAQSQILRKRNRFQKLKPGEKNGKISGQPKNYFQKQNT